MSSTADRLSCDWPRGIRVSYDVRGIPGSAEFPYVNDIATLKEAVAIAKVYPGVYRDGGATHIVRRFSRLAPDGADFHHSGGSTHRFRVFPDGRLQRLIVYSWPFGRRKQGFHDWLRNLPAPSSERADHTIEAELGDVATIASCLRYYEAERVLRERVIRPDRVVPSQAGFTRDAALSLAEAMIAKGPTYANRRFQVGYFEGMVGAWCQMGLVSAIEMGELRARMRATRPHWWNLAGWL